MSTISDKNKLLGVHFRKFTGVIAALIQISKLNFSKNFMHKTKCLLNTFVRLVRIQNYVFFFFD